MEFNSAKKRASYINEDQKNLLIELVRQYPELQSGKFSASFTCKDAQKLWQEITEKLHQVPGAIKDWTKWRKTWQDLKTAAKAKNSSMKKHIRGTGGGPASNIVLTERDQNVLSLIGPTVVEGHEEICEPILEFNWNKESEMYSEEYLEDFAEENNNLFEVAETENQQPNVAEETNGMPMTSVQNNLKRNTTTPSKIRGPKCTNPKKTRFERSIEQTEKLAFISQEDSQARKLYYNKKLELYKVELELKERKVIAQEKIAEMLTKIANDKYEFI